MSLSQLVHRLARLLAVVVIGFSGMYLIVYLLRWEWNRATIAGIFLLAAEVFLATDLILTRIGRVSDRIDRSEQDEEVKALAALLRSNRPKSAGPFAWLAADRDRTYVLVPFLLGAGIILSAVAFLVERISRVTAAPVAEHELARGLASMALPHTGLSPTGQPPGNNIDAPRRVDTTEKRNTWIIVLLVVTMTAAIVTLVFVLATRPGPTEADRALEIEMVVARRNLGQPDEVVASSLWGLCRVRVTEDVQLVSLEQVDPDDPARMVMTLNPAPAEFDTREFLGCLQDTALERAVADVVDVRRVPL